ncbi:hypothetical protein B0H11DRAFT_2193314 [Mycena galericulata]|nr:hypothetical protein B0H11DRAFT_2193314 [Mycena galericulata]
MSDDPILRILRHLRRVHELRQAYTGPDCDDAAISKQAAEEIAQEDEDAIYYPPESPKGRKLRDFVLAIPELMSEIFFQCLPSLRSAQYNYPSPHHAPLLLTRVCRRWRLVAISTPRLWGSLDLGSSINIRLFRHWMKRSGATPLSLVAEKDTLKLVLPYSHRWGEANLDLDELSIPALAAVRDRVPLLCHIHLKFSFPHYSPFGPPPQENFPALCNAFENAPDLRSVWITDCPPNLNFLPFPQLSSLSVFGAAADRLVHFGTVAVNLTRLFVTMTSMPLHFLEIPGCTLLQLKDLTISDQTWLARPPVCNAAFLLTKFSCPSLEKLSMSSFVPLPETDHSPFQKDLLPFLKRTPLITHMKMGVILDSDELLLDIITHIPALQELDMNHHRLFSAAFFRRLTYVPESASPPLCPHLRSFCVQYRHKLESPTALVAMVASRWRIEDGAPVARLRRVRFKCHDTPCAVRLAKFAEEGLKLT